jgi:dolichyl-phosphate-mannose-protein mannosyltransferase
MFDVHPPLGRLMFAGLAHLMGVPVQALDAPLAVPEMRVLPALFGTLLVPLVFTVLRQLGASRRGATLGAAAIALDNGLLVMSRLILPDIFLIVFGLSSVSVYLAARTRGGRRHWLLVALSALLAGCAFSVKWTGASGLGVVLSIWLFDAWRRPAWRRSLGELAMLVCIPVALYLGIWGVHFALLPRSGIGDAYMSARFRAQLPGSAQYNPAAPRLSFTEKLREVHHAIRYGNGALQNVSHPASSAWYTWPIMKHPIGLWEAARSTDGTRTMVILLGNAVVWWFGLLAAGYGLLLFLAPRERFSGRQFGFVLLLGATLLNFVPFMAIKRLMYLYHYLFALVMLVMLASYSIDVAGRWSASRDAAPWRLTRSRGNIAFVALLALMVAGFLYFSPFTYAYPLSTRAWDARFWVLHPTF